MQLFDFTVIFAYPRGMASDGKGSAIARWLRNNAHFAARFFSRSLKASTAGTGERVILLCGWSLTSGTMSMMAERLEADGLLPEIYPLGGLFGKLNTREIELQARSLLDHLRGTCHADEKVSIVGHSLGGVIGRYLVSTLGGDRYVSTLITLGSPHHGSPMARVASLTPLRWLSGSVLELMPGSTFMKELASKPIPDDVCCTSIFSETDDLCPPPCCEIPGADSLRNVTNISVGAYGHFELATDWNVYLLVRSELMKGIEKKTDPRS